MSRVTLVYEDESTIDFASMGDAKNHVKVQGAMGLVEVRKARGPARPCKHCGGTGVEDTKPERLMTRKQLEGELSKEADNG